MQLKRNCACGGGCPRCVQEHPVSTPGDRYEQEADRVADQVMRMPEPDSPSRATVDARASSDNGKQINGLERVGEPLPDSVRAFFEPRLGQDLGHVRVHAHVAAAEAARAVDAQAFTVGRDIVFDAGKYAPETASGQRLLAHELVHVVQQSGSRARSVASHAPPMVMRQGGGATLEGVSAATQRDFQTLLHEMEVAFGQDTSAGLSGADLQIWLRYNSIFEDAQAFAPNLEKWVVANMDTPVAIASPTGVTTNVTFRQKAPNAPTEIRTLLGGGRRPGMMAAGSTARTAARDTDPFRAFQGRWRGFWRQGGSSTEYAHNWQQTVPASPGSRISVQPVSIGRPGQEPEAAINAINMGTGTITGAVGVRGGQSSRPHVGFYPHQGVLLWVAREGGTDGRNSDGTPNYSEGTVQYSVFYEIVESGVYTIMGLDFTWTRAPGGTGTISNVRTKGGQYTTPPSR